MTEEIHVLKPYQARNMARALRMSAKNYNSGKFNTIGMANLVAAVGETLVGSEQTAEMYAAALEAYAASEELKASPVANRIYATLNQDITWADIWDIGRADVIAFRKGDKGLLTDLDHKQERKRAGVTFKDARLDYADRPEPVWIPMEFLDFSIEEEHDL